MPPLALAAALIFLAAPIAFSQTVAALPTPTPATASPQTSDKSTSMPIFDVASIRQNVSSTDNHYHIYSSPNDGNFRAVNITLKTLLNFAFAMPETRIVGGPAWIDTDKFDIEAKADPDVSDRMKNLTSDQGRLQKQQMLQSLLADRFKLTVHRETRQLPVYALVLAKGGPKFAESKENGTTVSAKRGHLIMQSRNSAATLAEELSKVLGRDVLDQTGIEGRYSIDLKWTPDDSAAPPPTGQQQATPMPDASGPSIFTAIQEQLGLKLQPIKAPVQVLVIDHIEPPTPN
jgi:uncharacterized protein (TIGR03435 family)